MPFLTYEERKPCILKWRNANRQQYNEYISNYFKINIDKKKEMNRRYNAFKKQSSILRNILL